MIRFPASPRAPGGSPHHMNGQDMNGQDMTGLEYVLVTAFVLIALCAAVPAFARAALAMFHRLA